MIEPATAPPGSHPELKLARDWLDALSSGACDETAFLRALPELTRGTSETGWDVLSLLDQYYRRGKISPELFRSLKSRLETQLLGRGLEVDISVPLPRGAPAPPAAAKDAQGASAPPAPPASTRPVTAPAPPITATPPIAPTPPMTAAPPPSAVAPVSMPSAARSAPAPGIAPARAAPPMPPVEPRSEAVQSGPTPAPQELAMGQLLRGRYLIRGVIGRGGTGTVFEGIDQYRLDLANSGQRIAIKVPDRALTDRPHVLDGLRREFQNLQSLSHPNIVRVHEYDRDGDTAFFTMEYLSGISLGRVLSARHQEPLSRAHALILIRAVGGALAHAHGRGVIHADVNPSNIFITDEGDIRLVDFGASTDVQHAPRISDMGLAEQSSIAAPRYASCERLEGHAAVVRDDVYSFACIMYLLLTGRPPFGERTALQARTQRLRPARPRGLTHPQWQALRRGLTHDPDRRASQIEALLQPFGPGNVADRLPVLLALLKVSAPRRRRYRLALGIAALLALLTVALWWAATNADTLAGTGGAIAAAVNTTVERAQAFVAGLQNTPRAPIHMPDEVNLRELAPAAPPAAPAPPTPLAAAPEAPAGAPTLRAPPDRPTRAPAGIGAANTALSSAAAAPAPTPAAPAPANRATVGRSRIELAADTVDVAPSDASAHLVVRRSGALQGNAGFSWWTESGTAKPGKDYAPVAPHAEQIESGKNSLNLTIPIIADATRHQSRSFYIMIGDPTEGTALGARTLAMVTIAATP